MPKFWSQYREVNWNLVKQNLSELTILRNEISGDAVDEANPWYYLDYINSELAIKENELMWDLEKNCVGMLEGDIITDILLKVENIKNASIKNQPKNNLKNPLSVQLSSLGIKKEIIDSWSSAGDNKMLEDLLNSLEYLMGELAVVANVLGIKNSKDYFDPQYVVNFLQGADKDVDLIKVVRTIRECEFGEKQARDISLAIMGYLAEQAELVTLESEWNYTLLMIVLLDFIFKRKHLLDINDEKMLLYTRFYQALALGVPVRRILIEELKETEEVRQYIISCKKYFDLLSNNVEVINIGEGEKFEQKLLGEILKDYLKSAGDKALAHPVPPAYAEKIYSYAEKTDREKLVTWLVAAIDIYMGLKLAQLIDWKKDHHLYPDERYQIDMLQLIMSFGMNGEFDFVENYYKKEEPFVPFINFINKLRETVDMRVEKYVDIGLRFTEFLHGQKLLASDKELIIFDQKKGQFIWNENI